MPLFVLSWMIRSCDPRSDVASEPPTNQVTGVTLAHGSFEMTVHNGSAWSGSTIYAENLLPEEARSDVGLWSMLCHLPTATPRDEFSGSLLLPLEGMGCCTSVPMFENECSPRPSQRRTIWEWLLLYSWPVPPFGMEQTMWYVQHRLIIVYNTLSSVLVCSYFSNSFINLVPLPEHFCDCADISFPISW